MDLVIANPTIGNHHAHAGMFTDTPNDLHPGLPRSAVSLFAPLARNDVAGLVNRFEATIPYISIDLETFSGHALVAALNQHLKTHKLLKAARDGITRPVVVQSCPLYTDTVVAVDARQLSDPEREIFVKLLAKVQLETASNSDLVAKLDAEGFLHSPFLAPYQRFAGDAFRR